MLSVVNNLDEVKARGIHILRNIQMDGVVYEPFIDNGLEGGLYFPIIISEPTHNVKFNITKVEQYVVYQRIPKNLIKELVSEDCKLW